MRRPWNLPDHAVYSLATYTATGANMNICTYVTPVSMLPKLYTIAVYHHTKSHANIQVNPEVNLQLLRKPHILLVNTLGKRSGNAMNKINHLQRKHMLDEWEDAIVLKDCAAIIRMQLQLAQTTGDHDLYVGTVLKYKTFQEDDILMYSDLIKAGIILKK